MYSLTAANIPRAYAGLIPQLRIVANIENTRAGKVYAFPGPFGLTIANPLERVLFDEQRDANPFFHLMEAIWMFSGENEVKWLLQFNKGFSKYAEPDGHMRGAYGFRWRYHFGGDQLLEIVRHLSKNPESRRAVLSMWDPAYDLDPGHNDYPCNTHIYFRNHAGSMDMTVCNRSNDLIWGMMGSNAVHMTLLQEAIASAINHSVGAYHVLTNNLHIYTSIPNFERIFNTMGHRDLYGGENAVRPFPLMEFGSDIRKLFIDCTAFVQGYRREITNSFLLNVAEPMFDCWQARKAKLSLMEQMHELSRMPPDNDWRKACEEWILRREISSSSILMEPLQMMNQEQKNTYEDQKANNGPNISQPVGRTSQNIQSYSSSESSDTTEENQSGSLADDQIPF